MLHTLDSTFRHIQKLAEVDQDVRLRTNRTDEHDCWTCTRVFNHHHTLSRWAPAAFSPIKDDDIVDQVIIGRRSGAETDSRMLSLGHKDRRNRTSSRSRAGIPEDSHMISSVLLYAPLLLRIA